MGAHLPVPMYRRTLPQRLRLEGGRCNDCGCLHFPPLARCRSCGSEAVTPHKLSGGGCLFAVTRIEQAGAPPEFVGGGYWVAIVELEEGLRITAQLTDVEAPPQIGQPVRAVVRRLYEEEGVVRYGFKFVGVNGE